MAMLKIAEIVPVFNKPILRWFSPSAERLVGITSFNLFANEMQKACGEEVYLIADYAKKYLCIDIIASQQSLQNIPKSGAIILAAEHPTDVFDDIVIMHTLGTVRQDYKVTANSTASKLKLWNSIIFPLSVNGEKNTASTNAIAIRNTIRWLKENNSLITFPGARPSSLSQRIRHGREYWSALPILLAEKTGAVILPVQLRLEEPRWQLVLKKHCRPIYNLLTFHVANSLRNTKAYIAIGSPIRYEDLPKALTREQQAQWLKEQAASL